MIPTNTIESIRNDYLSLFKSYIKENEQESFCLELPLLLEKDFSFIREYRLYRVDLAIYKSENPELIEINSDDFLDFKTKIVEIGDDFVVEISPFLWNGCEFLFEKMPENWNSVLNWFSKWFDEEETNILLDNYGFSGVVHSITEPEIFNGGFLFSIDFGSAPIKAFHELLDIFYQLGVKNLLIGNFDKD